MSLISLRWWCQDILPTRLYAFQTFCLLDIFPAKVNDMRIFTATPLRFHKHWDAVTWRCCKNFCVLYFRHFVLHTSCPPDILPNRYLVHLTLWPLDILFNRHFARLTFCPPYILPTRHFANWTFYPDIFLNFRHVTFLIFAIGFFTR